MNQELFPPPFFFLIAPIVSAWTQITVCSRNVTRGGACLYKLVRLVLKRVWAELLHPSFQHGPRGGCSFGCSFPSTILSEVCSVSQKSAWLVQVQRWKKTYLEFYFVSIFYTLKEWNASPLNSRWLDWISTSRPWWSDRFQQAKPSWMSR